MIPWGTFRLIQAGRGLGKGRAVPVLAAVLLFILLTGAAGYISAESSPLAPITVHFIDVGQGDATLVLGPDFTLLVDAGRHDRSDVVPYLRQVGVDSLDLLVGTHPHADHIGQFPQVLAEFPVREVWLSGDLTTTRTFERAIDAILESGAGYHEPRAGEVFEFGEGSRLRVEIVHPTEVGGDLNNGSIGMRFVYGAIAILLTGDAEAAAEEEMLRRGRALQANILHLGHHGSSTSTSAIFLDQVQPEVAVYSAGAENSYGHPHRETLQALAERGIAVYGTDVHGSIRVTTDGASYIIETDRMDGPLAPSPVVAGCGPGQVDINTAGEVELTAIVHIGGARARAIIEQRPFGSLDDLGRVSGIGPARLKEIKEQGIACVG